MEIVGTGGDEANTFNISTTSGFIISAAGIPVAKHGNHSVSSKCGAADLIEALGAKLELNGEQNEGGPQQNQYVLHVCSCISRSCEVCRALYVKRWAFVLCLISLDPLANPGRCYGRS